jgi:hypothetical protein
MVKTECPNCGSPSARYEITNKVDITLRCLCGYRKVVYSELESVKVQHNDSRDEVKLPKRDTFLWKTLHTLVILSPANSAEITQALVDRGHTFTVSDVSSYLTILRSKGLVEAPESKRGVQGGSTWNLTLRATELLGV